MSLEPQSSDGVALVDLPAHRCRWPVGDGLELRFCGEPADDSDRWCPAHHAIACPPAKQHTAAQIARFNRDCVRRQSRSM